MKISDPFDPNPKSIYCWDSKNALLNAILFTNNEQRCFICGKLIPKKHQDTRRSK